MQSFPLHSPSTGPGIYALHCRSTGQLYIGRSMSLSRRYSEWRSTFSSGFGIKSLSILEAVNGRQEWEFLVLAELPGVTEHELSEYEEVAIQRAYDRSPSAVINAKIPVAGRTSKDSLTSPKTTITSSHGERISYSAAAKALGCNMKSLQKRLAKRRKQGQTVVCLDDLLAASLRYRKT